MRKKKPRILFSQSIIWGFCAFISLIVSCSLPAAPDGGPRDTTPPKIIFSSVENNSTNVLTNELKWTFDEYVVLQSPSRNIFSSPPLPENTKYEIRGKSLIISWDNDLLSSSTYVIQMGAAIKDLHEGNVLKGIQWVFSTGSSLDSGEIIGQIIDSWSNSPAKDIAVCLYPDQGNNDSVIFKPALYSSRTDDSGFYKLEYIVRDKAYKIRAFKDTDGNNRLSVGEMTPIDENTTVSMNFWGFTPKCFEFGEKLFLDFLEENKENIKAEFYLPLIVNKMLQNKKASVKVLESDSKWFGVTYSGDKEKAQNEIKRLKENGVYPKKLWS